MGQLIPKLIIHYVDCRTYDDQEVNTDIHEVDSYSDDDGGDKEQCLLCEPILVQRKQCTTKTYILT